MEERWSLVVTTRDLTVVYNYYRAMFFNNAKTHMVKLTKGGPT